jgi:hypothetical protein
MNAIRNSRRRLALGLATAFIGAALVACAQQPGEQASDAASEPVPASVAASEVALPSAAAVAEALFIDGDTVLGPTNLTEEERPLKTCVQMSRFAHNEEIVWRVKVIDPASGEPMDDSALESVQVVMGDQTLDLHYGPHPRDNPVDFFWTVAWEVPEDYPSGTVSYTLEATAVDGRTGTWEQFAVQAAMLTITEDVREVINE